MSDAQLAKVANVDPATGIRLTKSGALDKRMSQDGRHMSEHERHIQEARAMQ
jgi:hypothetical protein